MADAQVDGWTDLTDETHITLQKPFHIIIYRKTLILTQGTSAEA